MKLLDSIFHQRFLAFQANSVFYRITLAFSLFFFLSLVRSPGRRGRRRGPTRRGIDPVLVWGAAEILSLVARNSSGGFGGGGGGRGGFSGGGGSFGGGGASGGW